jgi:hypothetical protein
MPIILPPVVATCSTEAAVGTALKYDMELVTADRCCITDTLASLEYELKSLPPADLQSKPLLLSHTEKAQLLPRTRARCDNPTEE